LQSMQHNFSGLAAAHLTLEWDGSAASLADAAARVMAAG
jgi:hypothetical protein